MNPKTGLKRIECERCEEVLNVYENLPYCDKCEIEDSKIEDSATLRCDKIEDSATLRCDKIEDSATLCCDKCFQNQGILSFYVIDFEKQIIQSTCISCVELTNEIINGNTLAPRQKIIQKKFKNNVW
jgi:Zn finger protein HypA/HybF involved in hydrogenase expression